MLFWSQVDWIPTALLPVGVAVLGAVGLVRAAESILGGVRRCLEHFDAIQERFRKGKR